MGISQSKYITYLACKKFVTFFIIPPEWWISLNYPIFTLLSYYTVEFTLTQGRAIIFEAVKKKYNKILHSIYAF